MDVPRPRSNYSAKRLAVLASAIVAVAACGSDSGGNAERFCGEVDLKAEQLTNPSLEHTEDIEPLLDLYRDIGKLAPLAIETEWDQLVNAYETASTVVPGNTESEQRMLAAIFSTEKSAAAVDRWLERNCAVDIGPVFTIVAHDT
jgi:hypothetical protein